MPANEKRARKKEHRDAVRAEQLAALRRRRIVRGVGAVVVLGVVAFLALRSGGDADETAEIKPSPTAQPMVACGGTEPPEAAATGYDAAPEMALEDGVDYRAIVHTSCGQIEIDLLEEDAPETVNNFVFLANDGYFEGLIWHRIERNFVIQTGDPNGQNGTPPDGAGYTIPDELPDRPRDYVYGTVAMANAGPDTGSSQWFIIVHEPHDEPAGLQTLYSIFGRVDPSSYEALDAIAKLETQGGNDPIEAVKPITPVYINEIEIIER